MDKLGIKLTVYGFSVGGIGSHVTEVVPLSLVCGTNSFGVMLYG